MAFFLQLKPSFLVVPLQHVLAAVFSRVSNLRSGAGIGFFVSKDQICSRRLYPCPAVGGFPASNRQEAPHPAWSRVRGFLKAFEPRLEPRAGFFSSCPEESFILLLPQGRRAFDPFDPRPGCASSFIRNIRGAVGQKVVPQIAFLEALLFPR
jgi:hypothetical protein